MSATVSNIFLMGWLKPCRALHLLVPSSYNVDVSPNNRHCVACSLQCLFSFHRYALPISVTPINYTLAAHLLSLGHRRQDNSASSQPTLDDLQHLAGAPVQ